MKDFKKKLELGITILSLVIVFFSCSKDMENSSPQISKITSSGNVVGYGNTVSLSAEGVDNDGDQLSYTWSSERGVFSANGIGNTLTWTAPDSSETIPLKLAISDGKESIEESILVNVIPAFNDFTSNSLLNFSINSSYCEYTLIDGKAEIKPTKIGYVGRISSPEFSPRLSLPCSMECTLGLFKELEDSLDYYYISMVPTYSSSSDKVITAVSVKINPNDISRNWMLTVKTDILSSPEPTSVILKSGLSSSIINIDDYNNIKLIIKENKDVVLELNDKILYEGSVLKLFVETEGYDTNWEFSVGHVGISSGDNKLTIDKIAIK